MKPRGDISHIGAAGVMVCIQIAGRSIAVMTMKGLTDCMSEYKYLCPLPTISQQEQVAHIADDDFFLVYGNPVVVNCDDGH